jgi:putative glutamine amidotransferase
VNDDRPAIGICTAVTQASYGVWDQPVALVPDGYIAAVRRADALVLMIPPDPMVVDDPDEVLRRIDGLILAGGNDLDPASYGHERHPLTVGPTPHRDEFEIALTRRAVQLDMPVLGICRGMQLLNVAFGGTLLQDLPEHLGHDDHRRVLGSFDGSDHDVRLTKGSLAAQAAGELVHPTKSHHHQGVDEIGDGLVVTGRSALDDLPEAIEIPSARFVLGVQWHPEADERSRVVSALTDAARGYRAAHDDGVATRYERPRLRRIAGGRS